MRNIILVYIQEYLTVAGAEEPHRKQATSPPSPNEESRSKRREPKKRNKGTKMAECCRYGVRPKPEHDLSDSEGEKRGKGKEREMERDLKSYFYLGDRPELTR